MNRIKRFLIEVFKDNRDMFGVNFDENKEALNKISTITSKILKNELRNEAEKTKSVENEEQLSEDIESTKDESKNEDIESTKDESKNEVIVVESSTTT